uniref:HTH CENPB-type domain-containing protein n=1 Tax=Hyaloperonospora arabidopsidis (strain Emoy2) TaxID=559515 RepID=M4B2Y2_HYAAE
MTRARHHLTIQEKNQLRAYHRERPDLTQEQLREWVHDKFGKWIGRSTIGKIASMPEETSANPTAKRIQSGRYPEMEAELYAYITATQLNENGDNALQDGLPLLSEGLLWTKANEILTRTRGLRHSVSLGWVQRFKKRHGLHRSQRAENKVGELIAETMGMESNCVGTKRGREEDGHVDANGNGNENDAGPNEKMAVIQPNESTGITTGRTASRKQFVSADDILLLTQVKVTKPWAYPHLMDGWQAVCSELRKHSNFNLEKTAGACQARVALLLDHLRAGNVAALRKSGTLEEYEQKRELLVQLQAKKSAFDGFQEDVRQRRDAPSPLSAVTLHDAAVVKMGEAAVAAVVAEATGGADWDGQRRLELLEIKMERELAEQRRHADEQVRRLERLQCAQLEAQQNQHAQLLSTIQQQQAMMLDLIKSVAAQSNKD